MQHNRYADKQYVFEKKYLDIAMSDLKRSTIR